MNQYNFYRSTQHQKRSHQKIWNRIRKISKSKMVVATENLQFKNHQNVHFLWRLPRSIQKKIHRKFKRDSFYLLNNRQYQNLAGFTDITMSKLRFFSVFIPIFRQKKPNWNDRDIVTIQSSERYPESYRDLTTSQLSYPVSDVLTNLIPIPKTHSIVSRFVPFNTVNRHQIINGPILKRKYVQQRETKQENAPELSIPNRLDIASRVLPTESVQDILAPVFQPKINDTKAPTRRNKTQILILLLMILRGISNSPIRVPPTRFPSIRESTSNDISFISPSETVTINRGETIRVADKIEVSGTLVLEGTLEIYESNKI